MKRSGRLTDWHAKKDSDIWVKNLEANISRYGLNGFPDLADFKGADSRIPIAVGAGPSLEKNFQTLIELDRSRFMLIAVSTILPAFHEANVYPDYAILAREAPGVMAIFDRIDMKRTTVLATSTSHPSLIDLCDPNQLIFYNNANHRLINRFKAKKFPPIHKLDSVAGTATFHAIEAGLWISGARQAAVVGMDLEVVEPKNHHAFGTSDISELPDDYWDEDHAIKSMRASYAQSLKYANQWAKSNPGRLINCTEGGAFKAVPLQTLQEFTNENL